MTASPYVLRGSASHGSTRGRVSHRPHCASAMVADSRTICSTPLVSGSSRTRPRSTVDCVSLIRPPAARQAGSGAADALELKRAGSQQPLVLAIQQANGDRHGLLLHVDAVGR